MPRDIADQMMSTQFDFVQWDDWGVSHGWLNQKMSWHSACSSMVLVKGDSRRSRGTDVIIC